MLLVIASSVMDDIVVRVMTWNVHGGVGLDGVRDFQRIADVIARLQPDILALQEVDRRMSERSLLALVKAEFVYRSVGAMSLETEDGEYGQLLLSRWPIEQSHVHDISVRGREPRRLISAMVVTPVGPVHVLATHLGLRFAERRAQSAIVCEMAAHPALVTIALGDFNDWSRWHSIQALLGATFPSRTVQRTFPSRLPILALDRIYCSPTGCLLTAEVVSSTAMMSDHLPLLATVRVSATK